MRDLPESLAPLAAWPQFLGYRLEWDATKNKMQKKPLHCRTGRVHSPVDPAAWGTFEEAARCPGADGVAFVFTEHDPFWFLDIDGAWQGGQWSALAQNLCQTFAGCAVEVSQSGTGLHLIGSGTAPAHGCRRDSLGLEFYTADRFVALTGTGATGNAAHNPGPAVLDWLVREYFPPTSGTGPGAGGAEWTEGPVAEWYGYADDAELVQNACAVTGAGSVFGDRATFADLWLGDPEALARAFPDPDRPYN